MLSFLPCDDYYIEVSRDRLAVENLTTGEQREHVPIVHVPLGGNQYELGDGENAINGFDHPRAFGGDFFAAQAALIRAIASVRRGWLFPPGRVLLHVQEAYEGGLSVPELAAGRDLCIGAGAKSARVYDRPGRLSHAEIQDLLGRKKGEYVPGLF